MSLLLSSVLKLIVKLWANFDLCLGWKGLPPIQSQQHPWLQFAPASLVKASHKKHTLRNKLATGPLFPAMTPVFYSCIYFIRFILTACICHCIRWRRSQCHRSWLRRCSSLGNPHQCRPLTLWNLFFTLLRNLSFCTCHLVKKRVLHNSIRIKRNSVLLWKSTPPPTTGAITRCYVIRVVYSQLIRRNPEDNDDQSGFSHSQATVNITKGSWCI